MFKLEKDLSLQLPYRRADIRRISALYLLFCSPMILAIRIWLRPWGNTNNFYIECPSRTAASIPRLGHTLDCRQSTIGRNRNWGFARGANWAKNRAPYILCFHSYFITYEASENFKQQIRYLPKEAFCLKFFLNNIF